MPLAPTSRRLILAAAVAALPLPARAASRTASITANAFYNWSTLPWSPNGTPATGDDATVNASTGAAVTISTPYTAASALNNVTFNGPTASTAFGFLHNAAFTANSLTIANTGTATGQLSSFPLTLTQDLILGKSAGSSGTFSLSGTGALSAFVYEIGVTGSGAISQTGGTAYAQGITMAANASSTASYSLTGGTLTSGNDYVSLNGTASFSQSAGTHAADNLQLAYNPGSTGTYSLSGGTLAATAVTVKSNGTFAQTGGTLTFNTFSQSGGSVSIPALSLPTSTNSYALSGGTLTVGTLNTASTPARLNWSAGTLSFTQDLLVGSPSTAFGANFSVLDNANKTLLTPNLYFGNGDTATASQSAGTNAVTTYFVLSTTAPGSSASYSLTGGLITAAEVDVAAGGTASFTHTGGTVNVSNFLIANATTSTGSYSLAGTASLHATTIEIIGLLGAATFAQSAGSNTVDSSFYLGYNAASSGLYTLSGNASLSDANASIGRSGTGSFVQTGGSHTVSANLNIASLPGSTGSYSISAGTLSAPTLYLGGSPSGAGGTALLSISGSAAVSVSSSINLFDNPANRLLLAGGSLSAPSINFNAHPERLSWTGGTLTLTNGYTVNASSFPAATAALSAGMTLSSNSPSTNAGTITLQTGSQLAGTTNLTNNGLISGAGSIAKPLLNNATLLAGPGTLTVSSLTNPAAGNILILPSSTLSLTTGLPTNPGTITLAGGTLDNTTHNLTNTGLIQGHGTLANLPTLTNNGTISITGGPLSFSGTLTGTGSLYLDLNTSLSLPSGLSQSLLSSSGPVTVAANSTLTTLSLASPNGSLDLASVSLTTFTPPAILRSYIANQQLFSSTASVDPRHLHALGYLTTGTTTLVKSALYGDANLDGKINADDYALLDRGFAQQGTTWQQGDFNYDGIINTQDYLAIDRTFLSQAQGPETLTLLSERESQFGSNYVSTLLASVPEPTLPLSSILYPLSSLLLPRRRR